MQRRKAVKMQKEHIGSRERNAMLKGGIWGVFFYAFSSKKAETKIPWNHSIQSCSEDFQCCSFTGKERDEETGYGYFGARYMDHELMTGWLSVDPMSDKYPNISPYNYCMWNPVKLVDPDGRDIWDLNSKTGELIWREASENDRIYARDGSYIDMDEGILTRGQSYTKESTGGRGYLFHLGDDAKKADKIFEFFADNAGVEFSLIGCANTPEDKCSENFTLTTSFDAEGDVYGTLYTYARSIAGNLRDHTHSHPGGELRQSGLPDQERIALGIDWKPTDKGDDVGFNSAMRANLENSAPNAVFNAYIYVPKGSPGNRKGRYMCYGSPNWWNRGIKYSKENAYTRYLR